MSPAVVHLRIVPADEPPPPPEVTPTLCPVCDTSRCAHWPNGVPPSPPERAPVDRHFEALFAFADHIAPAPARHRSAPCETCGRVARCEPCRARRRKERARRSERRQRECQFPRPRRARAVARPRSIGGGALTIAERHQLKVDARAVAEFYEARPRTWGDCLERELGTEQAPCPWVSCRYHLYLEIKQPSGVMLRPTIKINFPGREVDELEETCALRVARAGGLSLERVGELANLTMERIRQLEELALGKCRDEVDD